MSATLLAASGWSAAVAAVLLAVAVRRSLGLRMEAIARASHELRGPITAARLGLQLGARSAELSPARLRAIDLELERASLALDDLGHVQSRRRMRGASVWGEVDVQQLLAASVEGWRAAARARGTAVDMRWSGEPALILGDRVRLAQAVGNLIANAVEHGEGRVEVRGRCDPAVVRIEVIDCGPGLPAPVAMLARTALRGRGRRGRGLAIALAIVEEHGGRLAAAPAEQGGRLVLELPAPARGERLISPGR